ncbi:hypothetical protein IFM89_024689 [Coptis chinensis]|uniref:Vacuolar protein sorting-associated protein 26A n=1 Tax=Coptis chinensis TaxID=261450 RepID=A0A835IWZ8_9MAGN|nr:hypothetical protein IFM89_024689 [Coptis chinensis]
MNFIVGAFKPPCNVMITFVDGATRKQVPLKKENGQTVMVPLFQSQENIVGKVCIEPFQGKKLEHNGVKIELLGQIEMYFDRGNFYDFTSLVRELEVPGDIYERKSYPFEFSTVEMPFESYTGVNVRLRYVLKVTIGRSYVGNMVEHQDFMVIYPSFFYYSSNLLCYGSATILQLHQSTTALRGEPSFPCWFELPILVTFTAFHVRVKCDVDSFD